MAIWTHKVVKRARGGNGEYFDFPTAATFPSEEAAIEYAEQFASNQAASGVCGSEIDVRSRRQFERIAGLRTHTVATVRWQDGGIKTIRW